MEKTTQRSLAAGVNYTVHSLVKVDSAKQEN
jgi:hypothetical protein